MFSKFKKWATPGVIALLGLISLLGLTVSHPSASLPRISIPLSTGRWIPAADPLMIGTENRTVQTNLRNYQDSLCGMRGMTKINSLVFYSEYDTTDKLTGGAASASSEDTNYGSDFLVGGTTSASSEQIDSYTVLLLHCDGADGSTSFPDESDSNHTVTANGDAQVDTAYSVFGGASGLFDGAGDYLSIPDSDDWDFGTGDWTIDFRLRFDNYAATTWPVMFDTGYAAGVRIMYNNNQAALEVQVAGSYEDCSWLPANGVWHHIAVVRSGNTVKTYVDGTQIGTGLDVTGKDISGLTGGVTIGIDLTLGTSYALDGWIDEMRVSKGIARWTSNFTPPSQAYSANRPASAASDNDENTHWEATSGASEWWKYDLGDGNIKTARKLRVNGYHDGTDLYIKNFVLSGSNDDSNWTSVTTGVTTNTSGWQEFTFSNSTAYRYYKVSITDIWAASGNVSVNEFELQELITHSASNALDDDTATRWQGASGSNEWVKYDLGAGNSVIPTKLRLRGYHDGSNLHVKNFVFAGSNNDSDWTTLSSGTTTNTSGWQEFTFTNSTAFRYFRLNITDTWAGNAAVEEMEVLETEAFAKARSGIHFVKNQPAEAHTLLQVWNNAEDTSCIVVNDAAVPNTGEFSSTPLFSETSGCEIGQFSYAPGGNIAYANGEEVCLWWGDEGRCAAFLLWDSSANFTHDYTAVVQNTKNDAENVARLSPALDSGADVLSGGTASASSTAVGSNPEYGCDDNTTTTWLPDPPGYGPHCWLYDLGAGVTKTVRRLRLKGTLVNYGGWHLTLKDWELQGSNAAAPTSDPSDDTDWTDISSGQLIDSGACQDFVFSNSTAYRHYRLRFTNMWVSPYFRMNLAEAEMMESAPAFYIGSLRPIRGFKVYIATPNTTAGAMTVSYWSGSSFVAVNNLSDGTSSNGVSLAQTGIVTFDDTESDAQARLINGVLLYWYKVAFSACDTTTTISHITLSASFQSLKNNWDGDMETVAAFLKYDNAKYYDYTVGVSTGNTSEYAELDDLASGTDYVLVGFLNRQRGLSVHFIPDHVNTTSSTALTIQYWDGNSWREVKWSEDGTEQGDVSFAQSGIIQWTPPDFDEESKQTIVGDRPLYYYKLSFNTTLSTDVQVYYVTGIPVSDTIRGFKFPVMFDERLWLCNNVDGKQNEVRYSAQQVPDIFSGGDVIYVGDEKALVTGVSLHSQFSSSLYRLAFLWKKNETWMLEATSNVQTYRVHQVSGAVGCVAPRTVAVCDDMRVGDGGAKQAVVWQAHNGIYMSVGSSPQIISKDIENYWDTSDPACIPADMIDDSVGWADTAKREYHFLCASGSGATSLNTELVYQWEMGKWFKVDRGTGKYLQFGFPVTDTEGNSYSYGCIDTGYMERLEHGDTFDGNGIVQTFQTADLVLSGSLMSRSKLNRLRLLWVRQNGDADTITVTHYGDGDTTGTVLSVMDKRKWALTYGDGRYCVGTLGYDKEYRSHSLKFCVTTDDGNVFRPLMLVIEPLGGIED